MSTAPAAFVSLHGSGMLSREQLLRLFERFSILTSQSDVKKRIRDAVQDKQEAVAITTAIQEEIFLEMGIDPRVGIACLGKVNAVYENDMELMIQFYRFVAKEEMTIDEAELEPDDFAEKIRIQQKLQEQQLEMLKHIRKFHPDEQSAILEALTLDPEVSKSEGRVAQTTNVVIGGTVTDDATNEWLVLDQKVNSYPTTRGFTAIGTGGDDFVQAMVVAVESVLQQPIPEGQVTQKLSSRGKYVSVNIGPIRVASSEQVQAVYNAMRRDERMKYFL